MNFFNTDYLKTDEIMLKLVRTAEENPEKNWVPAYYFAICLPNGQKIGDCDLRIGHNQNLYYALGIVKVKLLFGQYTKLSCKLASN